MVQMIAFKVGKLTSANVVHGQFRSGASLTTYKCFDFLIELFNSFFPIREVVL